MNIKKHFLPKDQFQAKNELRCAENLMDIVHKELQRGDIHAAKYRMEDALKSIGELTRLSEKKYAHEKEKEALDMLIQNGIDLEAVRSFYGERQVN